MGWTKLFGDIVTSTIWREDDKTRLVWITMLAISDKNGIVRASAPGLAVVSNVSLEDCLASITKLSSPDQYSRTKAHDGRRIEECDGGWLILNRTKYREMGRHEDRKAYYAQRYRQRKASSAADDRETKGIARLAVLERNPDK